jgi:hypothetical protein
VLTFRAADGYALEDFHVYVNGTEQTVTLNGEGLYELVLGYLSGDVSITVEGVRLSGSVGIIGAPRADDALKAVKADGGLYVFGLKPGIEFRIYNVSGVLVYQGKASDTEQFVAIRERGFYIIVSEGSNVKVVL